jgi:methylenetetrahydrofolate reductase (NADPH)
MPCDHEEKLPAYSLSTMNRFPFRADTKLTDVLAGGKFTLSAEVIPPRNGVEQAAVLGQVEKLILAGAEFLAVTKGAGGSLRGGSLPIAQIIKEQFRVPCIAHFTCRDLTPEEVENQLMDHHYFGIRNILALRGDPPDGQPQWRPREGGYNFAHQLIEQIRRLNRGEYRVRPGARAPESQEKTDFCIGAAAYCEQPADAAKRLEFFRLKVEAGAQYGITDMLFDPESYARFLELLDKGGVRVPVLPGTRVLKSREQAVKMMEKFRVTVPKAMLDALPEKDRPGAVEKGVELFDRFVEKLRAYGAPGVHLFVISDTAGATKALESLAKRSGLPPGEEP